MHDTPRLHAWCVIHHHFSPQIGQRRSQDEAPVVVLPARWNGAEKAALPSLCTEWTADTRPLHYRPAMARPTGSRRPVEAPVHHVAHLGSAVAREPVMCWSRSGQGSDIPVVASAGSRHVRPVTGFGSRQELAGQPRLSWMDYVRSCDSAHFIAPKLQPARGGKSSRDSKHRAHRRPQC